MDTHLEARSLVKRVNGKNLVDGIHLQIPKGEFYLLIGNNSSGKTSLVEMVCCRSKQSAGELFLFELNVKNNSRKIRSRIGVVPEICEMEDDFSVLDNLLLSARYYSVSSKMAKLRARELLRFVFMDDQEDQLVGDLNIVDRRKVAIARAMISNPELLILDEPFSQISKSEFKNMIEIFREIKSMGKTVFATSNCAEGLELIADRVGIFDRGKIVLEGQPKNLITEKIGFEVIEFGFDENERDYYLDRIKDNYEYRIINDQVRIFLKQGQDSRSALSQVASENVTMRRSKIEDVYLKVTGVELINL